MAYKIRSVSITPEQSDFLDSHPHFSPSDLLQESIDRAIELHKKTEQDKNKLIENVKGLQQQIVYLNEFLEECGKWEEYHKTWIMNRLRRNE